MDKGEQRSRTLAIGDVHGCRIQLEGLFEVLQPTRSDTVVMLGDYVDRGPDSKGVIDLLRAFEVRTQLICLRGNHEIMMLEAFKDPELAADWSDVGGHVTIASYGTSSADIPAHHWFFLKNTVPYHETETHIFVHASVYPELPLAEQPDFMLYWERFGSGAPHQSGKTVVCGHTSQKSGLPANIGHAICIDTHAYRSGWLTALDVDTGQYWQVHSDGGVRTDHISACS